MPLLPHQNCGVFSWISGPNILDNKTAQTMVMPIHYPISCYPIINSAISVAISRYHICLLLLLLLSRISINSLKLLSDFESSNQTNDTTTMKVMHP